MCVIALLAYHHHYHCLLQYQEPLDDHYDGRKMLLSTQLLHFGMDKSVPFMEVSCLWRCPVFEVFFFICDVYSS